ncbi:phosphoribosylformimino-5-aminoimidazole carboxamide ribotide isomerase [Myxozyma melibiosi]|uniref:1-(5-phosphoribosyl)-5-[(5-phosphoribosylamino)methylideneamino] imidazole-4-carboxamide isomerase n=1 Tax=Myxozyma melibiosi TaxID=54550 RepID=A0ABR1FE95_9ASCO
MTRFRGCIDIHAGQVKQIVGGTLSESDTAGAELKTNFVASLPASHFGKLYKDNDVRGTHVIKLGPGCDDAAAEALGAWEGGLQIGGGITLENAQEWIDKGADKVIVTSYLFPNAKLDLERLQKLTEKLGKERLVIDLSCRRRNEEWIVAMNKWQTLTETKIDKETLEFLSQFCSEFLVHAADVEGLCRGIDQDLVVALSKWSPIPVTYAGGAKSIEDLQLVERLSGGKVDLTYGSALDIFGGKLVKFEECVEWNRHH